MTVKTVGILSPGDMGHTVGQVLRSNGLRVITCLEARSERTKWLATRADIEDVPTYQALVTESDVILSILVPSQAFSAARSVAQAVSEAHADILFADCNAIAPQTVAHIGELIRAAGGRFVDAAIIGPPPRKSGSTRIYASGSDVATLAELNRFGLEVIGIGDRLGEASSLKMCYAALTKGFAALCIELLTAAEILSVSHPLKREFALSEPALLKRMEGYLPGVPMKSGRWIGEMEEIAKTFEQVGLTPRIFTGAADLYRFVSKNDLARRTPEDPDPLPGLTEMISRLAGV
jgi:3-hydroxyisobutyrate dehydrogenase-like beta-hydroxyacid dehydrogenase